MKTTRQKKLLVQRYDCLFITSNFTNSISLKNHQYINSLLQKSLSNSNEIEEEKMPFSISLSTKAEESKESEENKEYEEETI